MSELARFGLLWLGIAVALLALRRRRYPTVWSARVLRPLGIALAVIAMLLGPTDLLTVLGALLLVAPALISAFRARDFLVLFARSDLVDRARAALDQLGLPFERAGQVLRVSRPKAEIRFVSLVFGAVWVGIDAQQTTPKLRLLESLLHKTLAN